MTRIPDFPGFSFRRDPKRPNFFKLSWREPLGQRSRMVEGFENVMDLVRTFAPRLTIERVHESAIAEAPAVLELEFEAHQERMGRRRRMKDSLHAKRQVRELKALFAARGWSTVADITAAELDDYREHGAGSASTKARRIDATLSFIRLLPKKKAAQCEDDILSYAFEHPGSQHIYQPWTDEEDKQYFAYLVSGMDVLAPASQIHCWSDCIRRFCHTPNFRQRMHLLCFYLLLSRHLTRPKELTRLTVSDWDSRRKALTLGWDKAKATPKVSLCDDEVSWLLDVMVLNRAASEPLLLNLTGGFWCANFLSQVTKAHIKLAGLVNRTNYEIKFTAATRMYNNPEEFTALEHERRLNRVRAISGHTQESDSIERYIKSRWGTELGLGARVYYNKHRVFPFRIEDYPIRPREDVPPRPIDPPSSNA